MAIHRLGDSTPQLAQGCWVADTASVIGNVIMAGDVSVWFGATIRGDNEPISIGAGSNIQDNAVLHSDPGSPLAIGANCTIGHQAIVHGCTIGNDTLVGMGATVLNGAVIGRNCLVGAGALVTEGKIIPDGSLLLGAPGKVSRQLDAVEIPRSGRTFRRDEGAALRLSAGAGGLGV